MPRSCALSQQLIDEASKILSKCHSVIKSKSARHRVKHDDVMPKNSFRWKDCKQTAVTKRRLWKASCSYTSRLRMLGWRLEAAYVFDGHIVAVVAHILVEHRKDLVVQDLELSNTISHFLERLNNGNIE